MLFHSASFHRLYGQLHERLTGSNIYFASNLQLIIWIWISTDRFKIEEQSRLGRRFSHVFRFVNAIFDRRHFWNFNVQLSLHFIIRNADIRASTKVFLWTAANCATAIWTYTPRVSFESHKNYSKIDRVGKCYWKMKWIEIHRWRRSNARRIACSSNRLAARQSCWRTRHSTHSAPYIDLVHWPVSIYEQQNTLHSRRIRPNCINRTGNDLCGWPWWTPRRESFVRPYNCRQLHLGRICHHFRARAVSHPNSYRRTNRTFLCSHPTEPDGAKSKVKCKNYFLGA